MNSILINFDKTLIIACEEITVKLLITVNILMLSVKLLQRGFKKVKKINKLKGKSGSNQLLLLELGSITSY